MNKKIFSMTIILLALAFLAIPVLAVPTQGQKLPVTLKFTPSKGSPGEFRLTNGGIGQRREGAITYTVELSIGGAAPLLGGSSADRPIVVYNLLKHKRFTIHEIHVISFSTEDGDGGFEGNALLQFTEYVSLSDYHIKTHGTFHGTGAFEGQTIVASYEGPQGGTWTGYILKT